jgi:uncharacterized protein (TIGR02246 family)
MNQADIDAWVQGYIRAWNSNDPNEIGELFAEGGLYYTGPFNEPWRSREGIVSGWLERADQPGSFRFRYQVLAASGDTGVVRGWTEYLDPPREYSNIWVIRLDERGKCKEFAEWWMKKKEKAG